MSTTTTRTTPVPATDVPDSPRQLDGLSHGGQALTDPRPEATALAATQRGVSLMADVVAQPRAVRTTAFDYLFDDLAAAYPAAHLPVADPSTVVTHLTALGTAMAEADTPTGTPSSTVPAVYTYWGQFVDHDMTANTDSDLGQSDVTRPDLAPVAPADVVTHLRNLRNPALNLDSLYGDGPTLGAAPPSASAALYDGIRMRVGEVASVQKDGSPVPGERIPDVTDTARDLPRGVGGAALVADHRNDENLVVAQLHTAFLRFHNATVDWVRDHGSAHLSDGQVFRRARQLVRWHYQWLTLHDFLPTITAPGVAQQVLLGEHHLLGRRGGQPYMPVEFSAAAFRFGHSMVRSGYDFNRNFGHGTGLISPLAPFPLMFAFTGRAPQPFLGQTDVLPFNWVIEWDRFVDKGSSDPDGFARKIDTLVTQPLLEMANEGLDTTLSPQVAAILKSLPVRNLLRGYLLAVPTGQAVAERLGLTPLSPAQLQQGASDEVVTALTEGGFLDRTPLWFYVLKEAEVQQDGNRLGAVGSRIVCETIIGQVRQDPRSFLHAGGWTPADGVRLPDDDLLVTLPDLLRFAGVL